MENQPSIRTKLALTPEHTNLHAFCVFPQERVESQRPDETLVLRLRAHPITQIPWVLNVIFLVLITIIINFLVGTYFTPAQMLVFNAFSIAFIFAYGWINFLLWYFNVGVVTDQRILDIDFHNLLYKEVTASNIEKAADVTAKVGGFFGSIFQFGDVLVKTEGGDIQNVEFENVPRPSDVVHIINDLMVNAGGD